MKNKWLMLCTAAAFAFVLTACGSTDEGKEETPIEPTETPATEVEDVESADKEAIEEDLPADATEKTDEDEKNNEEATDLPPEATLTESDEQEFSMYLLPNFKLTSEEPGRDIVYSEEDDTIFMRIETIIAEEGTYDFFKDNVIATLEASSDGKEPVELTDSALLLSGDGIKNVKAYKVDAETGPVTGIVFERNNLIIKLTIFDSADANKTADLLKMGETVTYAEKTISIQ